LHYHVEFRAATCNVVCVVAALPYFWIESLFSWHKQSSYRSLSKVMWRSWL